MNSSQPVMPANLKKQQASASRWNARKIVGIILKNVLMLGVFWWLIASGRLNLDVLFQPGAVRWSAYWLLAAALVPVSIMLLAYRWLMVLQSEGIHLTFWSGISTTSQANFFSILLPGVIGGDALKVFYLCRNLKERRTNAVVLTLFDRVIGVYGLVLFAVVLLSVGVISDSWIGSEFLAQEKILINVCYVALPLLLTGSLALLLFGHPVYYSRFFLPIFKRASFLKPLSDVSHSLHNACSWRNFCVLAFVSVTNHMINVGIFLCSARALGVEVGLFKEMLYNAWGMLGNLLPITPGGAGVAETAFYYLYATGGSDHGSLIALSGRIVNYLMFILLGLPFVIFAGSRLHLQNGKVCTAESDNPELENSNGFI